MSRACVLRPERPTQTPAPENPERVGGGAPEGRRAGGVGGRRRPSRERRPQRHPALTPRSRTAGLPAL
ncbi:unnamed protein product [Rangifer tarandus platyrhynchus]|uniref:Uncharacterized protein n=1 Tax=Rangifer tarandus platyrhynchus TaxID=3082113 RepID=A0AC59YG40_RANTA